LEHTYHMNNSENIETIWNSLSFNLKAFIISKVKNEDESKDILQEVYLKIHNNINTLKDRDKLIPWIYQIVRNQITDHFREKERRLIKKEIKTLSLTSSATGKYMDEAINDMIIMMNDLPPEFCEALCLTELEGLSQKEYALRAGLSYSGAKSRVQRARVMLKDMLMKCCHYQFDKYGTVFDIHQEVCCCCGKD
jgi:RNA polymerase sigma-70 factor, ECF subfamily